MQVLFVGDVVGKPGRRCLQEMLPFLVDRWRVDLVIANGENAAGGLGLTAKALNELKDAGVHVITGGNHIWDKKEVFQFIDTEPGLLRPANYPPGSTPGRGSAVFRTGSNIPVGILNLSGRVFMPPVDCPFRRAEDEITLLQEEAKIILVDFHAEATSEKQAMGWHLDGRVSAVIGTHTHVQTADERILPGGTAYITDAGMTGLHDSILGVDREGALARFRTGLPGRLNVSPGPARLNAVLLALDPQTGQATGIRRLNEPPNGQEV